MRVALDPKERAQLAEADSTGSLLSMDIEAQTFTREHPFEQPS
jgi:hypothetical protein